MEPVRNVAFFCVGRAFMFGWLGIGCVMFSFAFSPVMAFRAGAVLALGMAAILLAKAYGATVKNPKHTEVWIYLDDKSRPQNEQAKQVFGRVLRETYGQFARFALLIACGMFVLSIGFALAGFETTLPAPRLVSQP
jgi:hypothetical protein